jgi:hypothetical protein
MKVTVWQILSKTLLSTTLLELSRADSQRFILQEEVMENTFPYQEHLCPMSKVLKDIILI